MSAFHRRSATTQNRRWKRMKVIVLTSNDRASVSCASWSLRSKAIATSSLDRSVMKSLLRIVALTVLLAAAVARSR